MTPKYLRMFQWKIAEKTQNVINRGRCWKYSTEVGGCHETKEFARAYFSGWYVKNTHCSGWKIKTSKHAGQAVLVYWEIFFFLFLFYDMVCIGASQVALVVKNLPANAGNVRDVGSIPGSGRYPGGGHCNPLQYSSLENPHRQRSLEGYSP